MAVFGGELPAAGGFPVDFDAGGVDVGVVVVAEQDAGGGVGVAVVAGPVLGVVGLA